MGRALLLCAAVLQSAAALLPAALAAHARRIPRQRLQRTRAAPDDAALWDDEAGGALADVDLADLDDVDALYDARRRCDAALVCAARAGLRPAELCVDAPSEAVALLAHAAGVRRFAADTVAAAAALAAALPRDARFLARGARRLPRDKGAIGALGDRLVFEGYRPGGAGAGEPARERARTKVSASRRKFLEKRDAARAEAAPRSKPRRSRTLASAAALADALGGGGDLDGDLGGVFATADDAAAALAAARQLAARRPRDTVGVALPLAALDALSKDERSAFDVWPLLALDDPAVEAWVVDGGLDEEWETIKLPLGA